MNLHDTYLAMRDVLGKEIEPYQSVELVEEYRQYFKPDNIRVILLAESHLHTSERETTVNMRPIPQLDGYPTRYARFVYCLGYGENSLTGLTDGTDQRGTPDYWKIFYSCGNKILPNENFSPVLKGKNGTDDSKRRIRNKINLLLNLKKKGVWLVDTSIVALYNKGKKPANMQNAIEISWNNYTKNVVLDAAPEYVICIGKGVRQVVKTDLRRHFGKNYSVVYQPNAHISKEKRWEIYNRCSNVCCDENECENL